MKYVWLALAGIFLGSFVAFLILAWRASKRPPEDEPEIPPNHLAGREKQIEARLEAIRAERMVADFRAQLDDRHDWRVS